MRHDEETRHEAPKQWLALDAFRTKGISNYISDFTRPARTMMVREGLTWELLGKRLVSAMESQPCTRPVIIPSPVSSPSSTP